MRNFIGVVFAAGALAPALGAQQLVPGWVVEQRQTTSVIQEGGAAPSPLMQMRMRITLAGGNFRLDMLEGPTAGEYMVRPANGPMTFMVVPARRVARELPSDPAALSSIMAFGTTSAGAMNFDTLGEGPVMLGYRTRHYRLTPTSPTSMSLSGLGGDTSQKVRLGYVMDLYLAEGLPELEAARLQERMPSSAPGASLGFTGTSLRTEMHMEMGSGGMKSTTVTEVTSVSKGDVDPALFIVPADYAHVSFADEMRDLRARTDSLMQGMKRDYPGMAAMLKAQRDSMLGIRDTTATKKP